MFVKKIRTRYKLRFEKVFQIPYMLDDIKKNLEFKEQQVETKNNKLLIFLISLNIFQLLILMYCVINIIQIKNAVIPECLFYEPQNKIFPYVIICIFNCLLIIINNFILIKKYKK